MAFDSRSDALDNLNALGVIEVITIGASIITILSWLLGLFKLRCSECGYEWRAELERRKYHTLTCPGCGKPGVTET